MSELPMEKAYAAALDASEALGVIEVERVVGAVLAVLRPPIESAVREQIAVYIEREAAASVDGPRTSPRQQLAYRTAAHIARGGTCVAADEARRTEGQA